MSSVEGDGLAYAFVMPHFSAASKMKHYQQNIQVTLFSSYMIIEQQ